MRFSTREIVSIAKTLMSAVGTSFTVLVERVSAKNLAITVYQDFLVAASVVSVMTPYIA